MKFSASAWFEISWNQTCESPQKSGSSFSNRDPLFKKRKFFNWLKWMHTWFNWMFITHCLSLWFIKPANSSCSCKFRRCALWFDEFSRPDCCAKSKAGIPVDKLGSCPPPDPPPLDELRRAPRKMFWVWTCPGILRQSCGNSRSEIQNLSIFSKIVLTCEKKIFYRYRKTFEILGWRLGICNKYKITI